MTTQSNYNIFYYSTWLQIATTTFGKIFSREELLADLVIFPEIYQIKLMIHQINFPQKNTFAILKIKSCQKKKFSSIAKLYLFHSRL